MKKQLKTLLLLLGLLLWGLPSFAGTTEINVATTRACPDCSGTAYTIKDKRFLKGTVCECNGTQSLTLGPNVTVESGATVTFKAPTVNIGSGVRFESGAKIDIIREVDPPASPASLALSASPQSIVADGVQKTTLSAVVKDAAGNNVVDGTVVSFYTSRGLLSARSAKTANGTAQVTLSSSEAGNIGAAKITAFISNTNISNTTDVQFTSDVAAIALTVSPAEIPSDGATYSIITATATNSAGDPVLAGTTLSFKTTWGRFSNGEQTSTFILNDATGLMADFLTGTSHGTATITVSSDSVTSAVKSVLIYSDDPNTVTIGAAPSTLTADGTSTSKITMVATNAVGEFVADGTSIAVTSKYGALSSGTATTKNGVATVTYTAPFGVPTGGKDTITATTGNATGTEDIFLVAASVDTVTVTTGSKTVVADGSSGTTIRANVVGTNGDAVPDGTSVEFSTTAGSLVAISAAGGVVINSAAQTRATTLKAETSGGVAQVTLISATNLGTATVTAASGGVNGTVKVTFVAGAVNGISVTADPNNLSAGSSTISTIEATATDSNGNPVSGETITFTATAGSLSGASAVTNASGIATVTYTAPNTVPSGGKATITAKSTNGKSGTGTVTIISVSVGSISASAGSSSIVANGTDKTTIRATVKNSNGGNVPDGTTVTFSKTAGTLSATTDDTINGVASVTLTSATNIGTAKVTATAGGYSATVTITFVAGPSAKVTVVANPTNLTADGASTSSIVVMVLDANDNPVADGTSLTLSTDYGTLGSLTAKTSDGKATVTYTAPSSSPAGNQATVTVVTTNNIPGTATINLIGSQIATITLSSNPTSLPADGKSTATITATVALNGGGTPPDGTTVDFSITQGGGTITSSAETASGKAYATLTSATTAETATILAESGGKSDQINVDYTPGSVTVTIIPNSILGTGDQESTVTALVKNASGTPQINETVAFKVNDKNLGTITPASINTDANGEALVTFAGAATGGTATITASWTASPGPPPVVVTGSADVAVQPPPAFIQTASEYPNPSAINIRGTGGQSSSQIVFDVKDSSGNLVVDGYRIDFIITSGPNGGESISPTFATTVNGKVSTILESGTKSGPVSIKGSYYNKSSINTTTGQITIVAGPPVGEEFGISATSGAYRNISGLHTLGLQNTITLTAGDIYGNAIPDNTALSFKTYNTGGLFNPGSSSTTGGVATNTLLSVSTPKPQQGFLSATGETINGGRTTHVTSIDVASSTISSVNNSILYIGTDGGGVYKSLDSGRSWTNISRSSTVPGQNWIDPYVNDIAVDPDDNNTIFAATGYLANGRVYRSFDGGANWNSNDPEEFYGIFSDDAAVLSVLSDDVGTSLWVGTQGDGLHYTTDATATPSVIWTQAATGLGAGTTVVDIVKVPGTHGATAILYAGTARGVYKSANGGANWSETGNFTGDNITAIALHPTSTGVGADKLYVGTRDAGVWFSNDDGATWTQYVTGLGKGLSATTPAANSSNTGTGIMEPVTVLDNAESEFWTVTCITAADDGGTFSVTGTLSGSQINYDITGGVYTIANVLSFTIKDGATDFVVGDTFTFTTTRDSGMDIKDLLVDAGNDILYAVTYFWGSLETHAVGNVYSIDLDGFYAPVEPWSEETTGLPQYDPPDDTMLFAQHAIASNVPPPAAPGVPAGATAVYMGGEGINFYKATTNLATGEPSWYQSKSGLTNLIMTRMPVLFSGNCSMTVTQAGADPNFTYTVYIEDTNGNPPISGSLFTVKTYDSTGDFLSTVYSISYSDGYTHQGTFRNPNDALTDNPYVIDVSFTGQVTEARFSFIPTCQDSVPGCSGSSQERSYFH